MKRIADFLEKSPAVRIWVRLNQSVTLIALIVAVGAFTIAYVKFNEDKLRQDEDRISKAWDTVTKMAGKKSNGGQINALQILVKNGISLDKINLQNTYLVGDNLKGASLRGANLKGANLVSANLQGANLSGANLDGVQLYNSNLGGVTLDNASFTSAHLAFAKLDITIILAKSLQNADLTGVNFVLEDSEGTSDFAAFSDTVAESSGSENRQWRIDQACANQSFNAPQDPLLPINLPKRACSYGANYQNIQYKVYDYSRY